MSDKPPVLQDIEFTVQEGVLYKASRTGAIWMNKLFFSSVFLLAVWILAGYFAGIETCDGGLGHTGSNSTSDLDSVAEGTCSVILTPTAKYLGAMSIISFLASLAFGGLGLIVGKNIMEVARAADEVGAENDAEE